MFITLTINTTRKKTPKKSVVRIHKRNADAAKGWRKKVHMKKRSVAQRMKAAVRKSMRHGHQYRLGGQTAMF